MAQLTADELQDIVQAVSGRCFRRLDRSVPIDRTAIEAAANATSDWIDPRVANYVSALPEPWKSASDATDKSKLFAIVALRKVGINVGA